MLIDIIFSTVATVNGLLHQHGLSNFSNEMLLNVLLYGHERLPIAVNSEIIKYLFHVCSFRYPSLFKKCSWIYINMQTLLGVSPDIYLHIYPPCVA